MNTEITDFEVCRPASRNSYHLVEHDHLVGKLLEFESLPFKFIITRVFLNQPTGRRLVELLSPNGKTQIRRYGTKKFLLRRIDFEDCSESLHVSSLRRAA